MANSQEKRVEKYLDMGHSEAQSHAKTQQKVFEKHVTEEKENVTRVISEFLKTNLFGFAYHYIKSRFGKRHPYQSYPRNGDTGIYKMQPAKPDVEEITISLLSDWASDTAESDAIGKLVANHVPDYTIHLGDVYFVGTAFEIAENFTAPYASWYYGESGSLALSGNHEMYSNGNAFFQHLLPAMYAREGEIRKTQQAGFFCLENDHWRIIGLDTGYTSVGRPFMEVLSPPDCHLKKEQIYWLRNIVKLGDSDDKRGLIFLSHHPYLSAFRDDYKKPGEQIEKILGESSRPVIWFWGHDHRMVIYKEAVNGKGPLAYGRCIGHGGLPVETNLPDSTEDMQRILLYDRRVRKSIKKTIKRYDLGYNGFVTLKLKQHELIAEYRDLEDVVIAQESWHIDTKNGQILWNSLTHLPELAI